MLATTHIAPPARLAHEGGMAIVQVAHGRDKGDGFTFGPASCRPTLHFFNRIDYIHS